MQHDDEGSPSDELKELLQRREQLRQLKRFAEADKIRLEIERRGYKIIDTPQGQRLQKLDEKEPSPSTVGPGKIAVFGSGEMSPSGRRIHEYLIKDLTPPVKIALLETPAGFEDNPHHWYKKLAEMMEVGLQNFQPDIASIPAWRKERSAGTNSQKLLEPLLTAHYIHTGAGSPTYAITHLRNTLAFEYLVNRCQAGTALSFASAATIAMGSWALPVYEIYKVGQNPFWKEGLGFFRRWNLDITFIPHWNNSEGGPDFDTSRCFMGQRRFTHLWEMLPRETVVVGIDEQTAAVFDTANTKVEVRGIGSISILKDDKELIFKSGEEFDIQTLKWN